MRKPDPRDDLDDNPTTGIFRRNMDAYLRAAHDGKHFRVHRYHRPIGILGPPNKIPDQFRAKARRIPFSDARKDLPSITSSMMRDRAIIITKLRIGANAVRNRRKRPKLARDRADFAAIWPLPEDMVIGGVITEMKRLSEEQQATREAVSKLVEMAEPLFSKLSEKAVLDQEIAERRQTLDNLETTRRRIIPRR